MPLNSLPSSWTLWPSPDPDVFGDKVYSWRFIFVINLPLVLAFYSLLVFTPLREWTGIDPLVFAAGCAIQLGVFAGVLLYGHNRMHLGLREMLTYGGNLAATLSLPLATDKALFVLWVLYFLIVFFESFGNPKSAAAFALTLIAPMFSLLGQMSGPQSQEKILFAVLSAAIGGVIYLVASYVASWTRQGALEKADRARQAGAQDERVRLERSLAGTLGSALSEIALWHEVALAGSVPGAQAVSVAKARERANAALTELRAVVSGIDDQLANMAGLAGEIQRRVGGLCGDAGVLLDFKIDALRKISLRDAYHVTMIAIEAVENAVLHGKPGTVTVSLSGEPLGVAVEDDGTGFDPATTPRRRGMRNLEELAKALNAPLEIESAPGKGTRIRVRVASA